MLGKGFLLAKIQGEEEYSIFYAKQFAQKNVDFIKMNSNMHKKVIEGFLRRYYSDNRCLD